jgi:hypothetical protein
MSESGMHCMAVKISRKTQPRNHRSDRKLRSPYSIVALAKSLALLRKRKHLTVGIRQWLVRCLSRAEQTGSLAVTCSATTETARSSVYGIAQLVTRFCRKKKDLVINLHKA